MLWIVAEFTVLLSLIWASIYVTVHNDYVLSQHSDCHNNNQYLLYVFFVSSI